MLTAESRSAGTGRVGVQYAVGKRARLDLPNSGPATMNTFDSFDSDLDLELQQELLSMFELDAQQHLETYTAVARRLQPQEWKADIQQLYRSIHTIKGSAATVSAEAILPVATALEDILSDLRCLETAPPLGDGELAALLQEAGELMASSLSIAIVAEVRPTLDRLEQIHALVSDRFTTEIDEQTQLYQEFASQGFDLVVLDLELAIERLTSEGAVPDAAAETAAQTLGQLEAIGRDLQLGDRWYALLNQGRIFLERREADFWHAHWPRYLAAVKECARQGGRQGELVSELDLPDSSPAAFDRDRELSDFEAMELSLDFSDDTYSEKPAASESDRAEPASLDSVDLDFDLANAMGESDDLRAAAELDFDLTDGVSESAPQGISRDSISELTEETPFLARDDSGDRPDLDPSDLDWVATQFPLDLDDEPDPQSSDRFEQRPRAVERHPGTSRDAIDLPDFDFDLSSPEGEVESAATWEVDRSALEAQEFDLNTHAPVLDVSDLEPSDTLDSTFVGGQSSSFSSDRSHETLIPDGENREFDPLSTFDPDAMAEFLTASDELNTFATVEPNLARPAVRQPPPATATPAVPAARIPVPLERLDRSAQYLIEVLLSVRASQGFYQSLHSQLAQLVSLAEDSVQYISQLRHLQDDYALLDNPNSNDLPQGLTPERYRQGYTTINRLLEISLRLSEIGAEVEKTARQTGSSLERVDRSAVSLQRTIENSRLQPFGALAFKARSIVRDLVNRQEKPANLFVAGEELELDAGTLRTLEPAVLHLLRNAYDHGLESPEERAAIGKPETGEIALSLKRQGSRFLLEVRDDGRGVDAKAIARLAREKGLPNTNTNSPEDLLAVLCQPGFSSQSTVSNISGRGVGMDVVAYQIDQLGGRLSLETEVGFGASFQLEFPVPQLLVPCILLQAGDRVFALPNEDLSATALFGDLPVSASESNAHGWSIRYRGEAEPGLDLFSYWQLTGERTLAPTAIATRICPADRERGIWLLADDLLGQSELLVDSLPSPLVAPTGMLGASLQPEGTLIPVLDPVALAAALVQPQEQGEVPEPIASPPANWETTPLEVTSAQSTVLVVDDAALVRRRIEASLSAYGYEVFTCSDGMEAWKWLQTHPLPALVLTDIEMPGLDGFTLIDRCRQAGIEIPMLVISSRLSEEWSAEAKRVGASDFLTKGFATGELLAKVKELLLLSTR